MVATRFQLDDLIQPSNAAATVRLRLLRQRMPRYRWHVAREQAGRERQRPDSKAGKPKCGAEREYLRKRRSEKEDGGQAVISAGVPISVDLVRSDYYTLWPEHYCQCGHDAGDRNANNEFSPGMGSSRASCQPALGRRDEPPKKSHQCQCGQKQECQAEEPAYHDDRSGSGLGSIEELAAMNGNSHHAHGVSAAVLPPMRQAHMRSP
jgi:hypothetical protein